MTTDTETREIVTRDNDMPPAPLVVSRPPTAILPDRETLELIQFISGTVVNGNGGGGMVPDSIKTQAQAAAVMLAGWEVGIRPMTALRHVYLVNGKTNLEARAMMGVVRAADPAITFDVPEYTHEAVTIRMHRPGQPNAVEVRYTLADAKASGQYERNPTWKKYTRDMLYAAAAARVCRIGAPDLINAIDSRLPTVNGTEAMMVESGAKDAHIIEATVTEIPRAAYNDGDSGAIPAEVAAHDTPTNFRPLIRDLLKRMKAETDAEFFSTYLDTLRGQYPHAHNDADQLVPSKLTNEEAEEVCNKISADLGLAPPSDEEAIEG